MRRLAATLMVQGTTSSAGKSFLVAGLCRVFARRGLAVAPFKAQNMALNAAVTADGGEIGRSTAVQAEAARVPAEVAMNPVLLQGETDISCQVVYMGHPIARVSAAEYFDMRAQLWPGVRDALRSLRKRFDLVIIEGAGSPVELNLLRNDFVNMRVAHAADAPVILISEIERGGVFASVLGTLDLMPRRDRARVKGLVINRFRGDPALFRDGVDIMERRSGLAVLAVIPHLDILLPAEDALDLPRLNAPRAGAVLDIVIIALPHVSNFDDFEPLLNDPGVSLRLVDQARALGRPDLIIIPGTKTTMADLAWLRERGLDEALTASVSAGSAMFGVCSGYQMLGESLSDPSDVEGAGQALGLGLLSSRTTFEAEKVTRQAVARVVGENGILRFATGIDLTGYEIHAGRTDVSGPPVIRISGRDEGCTSSDGWVLGTSLHGVLADSGFRSAVLRALALRKGVSVPNQPAVLSDPLDRLADGLTAVTDLARLDQIIWGGSPSAKSR